MQKPVFSVHHHIIIMFSDISKMELIDFALDVNIKNIKDIQRFIIIIGNHKRNVCWYYKLMKMIEKKIY